MSSQGGMGVKICCLSWHLCAFVEQHVVNLSLYNGTIQWLMQSEWGRQAISNHWKDAGPPRTRKFKVTYPAKIPMATTFWDADGVMLVGDLSRGTNMKGQYYANLLLRLCASIKVKRRCEFRLDVLLQQDTAPVHTSKIAMRYVWDCGFDFLPHPLTPDLAPNDCYFFNNWKRSSSARDIVMAVR